MFIDRRSDRPQRHLEWRIRLLGVGAIFGVLGIYFDEGWLIWAALAVLLGGFLLRFVMRDTEDEHDEDEDGDEQESDER